MTKTISKTARLAICFLVAGAAAASGVGCGGEEVGAKCFIGLDIEGDQAVISSPALDCSSRQCLHVPQERSLPQDSQYADLCTADCTQDSDCENVGDSCVTGFTCAVPVTVGPFCCLKLCVCKDYLIIPEGGRPTPIACEADNADNMCCNLPGRENLAECGGA